jgi:hypothetical protein
MSHSWKINQMWMRVNKGVKKKALLLDCREENGRYNNSIWITCEDLMREHMLRAQ